MGYGGSFLFRGCFKPSIFHSSISFQFIFLRRWRILYDENSRNLCLICIIQHWNYIPHFCWHKYKLSIKLNHVHRRLNLERRYMTNKVLLNQKIEESGLQPCFIIKTLGITPNSFYRKKDNLVKFRASEIYVLCDLLNITDPNEKRKIFYADSSEIIKQYN